MKTILSGASVFTGRGFEKKDILIENGMIALLSDSIKSDSTESSVFFEDYSGKYIFPGFIDVHVHFREPGFLYKEDIESGSKSAAKGGYTHVFTMPNLNPVPDSIPHILTEIEAIKKKAVVKVFPYASVTEGEKGKKLSDIEGITEFFSETDGIGGDVRLAGFSDDGVGIEDDGLMQEAMLRVAAVNGIISAHCEVKALMGGKNVHDGCLAKALGYRGISSRSEWAMIGRDLKIAEKTKGIRYHVCHVSAKESLELIRTAKAEGIDVTCETAPHYLILCDEDILEAVQRENEGNLKAPLEQDYLIKYGIGRFKMNPPIRSAEDRKALLEAIKDGTIDMVATDHAPHSVEEKSRGFDGPMGVTGLETAFPVLYTKLVLGKVISLEKLTELMSINPAKRFGIEHGISEGLPADLCVFDLNEEYVIDPDTFLTKGRFSPFEGMRVKGKHVATYVNGKKV